MPVISGPILLQPGQTTYFFRGVIGGPVLDGGAGDYIAADGVGNVVFSGSATLPKAIDGQSYTIAIDAIDGSGVLIPMYLIFDTIRFTGTNSFEGGQQIPLDPLIGAVVGNWDSSRSGDIGVFGTFRLNVSAVPEPSSVALLLMGLSTLVAISRRKILKQ